MTSPRQSRPAVAGQLALELPGSVPYLEIAPEWKAQQRLWGHSFHPMCSYLASFPAALAHAFIARYSRPGDIVFDPFSGRGTTPLQAVAEGRIGVGNDLNPFAHLLTAAKVDPPSQAEARTRLARLRLAWASEAAEWRALGERIAGEALSTRGPLAAGDELLTVRRSPEDSGSEASVPPAGSTLRPADLRVGSSQIAGEQVPLEVAVAFHPATLGQLLYLRSVLQLDVRADRFLAAALTGILHGKSASYLSEIMPNTFSMAPRYVRDYVTRTGFRSPARDVFECLGLKLARLYRQAPPSATGLALLGDARTAGSRTRAALHERGLPDRVRLLVSSPPYLRVVKYGYYNWLRTWLLGYDAHAIDATLDDAHHREPYLAFMREVLVGLRSVLADDAVVVLVIGDVELDRGRRISDGVGLAERVWEAAAAPAGYALAGLARDDVAAGRKMTKLWGDEAGRATKTDGILVLGATELGRRRAVAGAHIPIDWTWPVRRPHAI